MAKKTFTVSVGFDSLLAENELEAAKIVSRWLQSDSTQFIYDVEDEETGKKFTVDLSEDDEDAVLPNND